MSGGWAGRRPGVAGRARLRLVGARCGWVWAWVPTLGIGGLRAGRGRDASDARDASKARHARDASKARHARDASDARDASKARHAQDASDARDARHASNARSAADVRP